MQVPGHLSSLLTRTQPIVFARSQLHQNLTPTGVPTLFHIPEDDIHDAAVLAEAYDRSVRSQLDLTKTICFEAGWRFAE